MTVLEEAQELGVLIRDPDDRHRLIERAGQQCLGLLSRDDALGTWNRIAVRIDLRMTEHLVDPFDEPFRHDVLELLGLLVHLGPAHAHHLDQEELDEPVAAQHHGREPFARCRESHPAIRLVKDEARFGEGLDHGRRRPRGHVHGGSQLTHRN